LLDMKREVTTIIILQWTTHEREGLVLPEGGQRDHRATVDLGTQLLTKSHP
jgi:hypothetical protein